MFAPRGILQTPLCMFCTTWVCWSHCMTDLADKIIIIIIIIIIKQWSY